MLKFTMICVMSASTIVLDKSNHLKKKLKMNVKEKLCVYVYWPSNTHHF